MFIHQQDKLGVCSLSLKYFLYRLRINQSESEDDYEEDVFVEGGLCFLFCRPCCVVLLKTWILSIPIFVVVADH